MRIIIFNWVRIIGMLTVQYIAFVMNTYLCLKGIIYKEVGRIESSKRIVNVIYFSIISRTFKGSIITIYQIKGFGMYIFLNFLIFLKKIEKFTDFSQ